MGQTPDTRRRLIDEEEQSRQDDINQPLLPQSESSKSKIYTSRIKQWLTGSGSIPVIAGSMLTLLFLSLALWFIVARGDVPWHHDNNPKPSDDDLKDHLVQAKHGAVACDVEVCSRIGVDIMRNKNGSAVDAAIASTVCIGVINGFASGIGGGGFMVVRHENGSSKSINFREMAPAAASRDMYKHDPKSAQYGGLSVAVPGELAGFHAAWEMYGQVEWATLFEDTIKLCEEGYAVTERLVKALEWGRPLFESRGPNSEWGFLFKSNSTKLVTLGDTIKRPVLGNTLKKIAKHGWKTLYHGDMAQSLVDYVQSQGGILTMQDMASYNAVVTDTIKTWAFGIEILTCPSPCSGPALIEGLNIAEGLDMTDGHSPLVVHRVVETMKWLSAGRTELGDPFDTEYPNQDRVDEIQTKKFAARVRQNISDDRTYGWKHYNPSFQFIEAPGTSHINTLDEAGMAVSLTSTVNLGWGARILDPVTGIILNGEMDDFSIPDVPNAYRLQPSVYNFIKPGKRPLSSCAPVITVQDDRPSLVIGGSGGSHITTSVVLTILKVYKWGYSALDAIHSPRVHHQLIPESVFVESGVEDHIIQGLKDRGHDVRDEIGGSVVQLIYRKKDGVIDAVADFWRKGGKAARY